MNDPFFNQTECDRCKGPLHIRTMSWFTDETLCSRCSDRETTLKMKLFKKGMNPDDYEGCGHIPDERGKDETNQR